MATISTATILEALSNLNDIQLITSPNQIPKVFNNQVPDLWGALLASKDNQLSILKQLWQPISPKIPQTMAELQATLQGIAILIEDGHPPSLLYIFLNKKGKLSFHRGYPPLKTEQLPQDILPIWSNLPEEFRNLYIIHNGWFSLHSRSRGHLPVNKWSFLSSSEWLLEDEVVAQLPISPKQTLIVYDQGGGGYLGFVLPSKSNIGQVTPVEIWLTNLTEPDTGIDFWSVYDEMTVASFLEMAWREDEE